MRAKPLLRTLLTALIQVYVPQLEPLLARAAAAGAWIITDPTDFYGGQRLAQLVDPGTTCGGRSSSARKVRLPAKRRPRCRAGRPIPRLRPSYVHRTIDEARQQLTRPGAG